MSSMRNRNKFCFSLDNSSSSTSSNTVHLNRWSEVVPPKTALTFAALWDPEEGMVTFSGAALLESESLSDITLHPDVFDDDGDSQLTSDQDSDRGSTTSENTATLVTFQDSFKAFLHRTPFHSKEHLHMKAGQGVPGYLQARASSTFDGLDIYSHDIQVKPKLSLQLSCVDLLDIEASFRTPSAFGRLRLRSDLMLDSCQSESEESGSSSESRTPHLRSRFSTTTTSTSNYVDVTASAFQLTHTTEISYIPEQKDDCVSPARSWPSLPQRRRLRKRRPLDSDCIASATNSSPSTPRKISPKASMFLFSSPSSTARSSSSSPALGREEARRSRFSRRIGTPMMPVLMPTPMASLPPATSPATPSTPKSPRLKFRFALLPKRKSRQASPEDGWVFIEVTPIIQQRYMADLAQD